MLIGAPCLRTTVTTGAAVALLFAVAVRAAAADAVDPLEAGWWNTARGSIRASGADPAAAARLAAINQLEDDAARVAATRQVWLRDTRRWEQRWSRPLMAGEQPVAPVWAGPLVAWEADRAVHAVFAANGRPAWRHETTPDTTLFLGGTGPRQHADGPGPLASFGQFVFAGMRLQPAGLVLVCLDCSTTAQGRLAWATDLPADASAYDGNATADAELCAFVCRSADERAPLTLVACDARDGRILWRRPCGTTLASDGRDHGRGHRTPVLHEGLVVVADHAGSVTAYTRAGQPAWTYRYEASSVAAAVDSEPRQAASLAAARDTLVVAARDHGGLMALDDTGMAQTVPRLRWQHAGPTRLVGTTPTRIVVADGSSPRLHVFSVADGSTEASTSADRASTAAILGGGLVIRAVSTADGDVAIEPLDVATLLPLADPFALGQRGKTLVALAIAPGALAVATPGMLSCVKPSSAP